MPGLLYEYDQDEDGDDGFVLTPDYDALLAEYAAAHPDDPIPQMGDRPEWHFENYLKMVNRPPKKARRGRNGRFTKTEEPASE
jgi:hypothetical protein